MTPDDDMVTVNLAKAADTSLPWFRRHPRAALVVAVALFLGIFVLRVAVGQPEDVLSLLFTLPVALIAMAFGFRAGMLAGLAGAGLVLFWVVLDDVTLSPLGWASRVTPMLLLGGLLGHAVDRLRRSEDERHHLAVAARRQRDAIEINDTIVQGLSAAKWALEAGNSERALDIVEETLRTGHDLVSALLRDAAMGPLGDRDGRQPVTVESRSAANCGESPAGNTTVRTR